MYIALALIGLLSQKTILFSFQKSATVLITVVVCLFLSMYWINYYMPFATGNLSQLLRLTSMFFLGAVFFMYRDQIMLTSALFLGCLVALLLFSLTTNLLFIPYTLAVGYLVFYLAFIPKGAVRKFNLLPDYSYGLYIYGFPVQQSIAFLYPSVSLPVMLLSSFMITLMLASLSWHFVEKPSLNLKKHFLIVEKKQKLEIS
jgi:peptidoglycan/LPS O-acetylase OafA/YrhL